MKILLDHNLDRRLDTYLPEQETATTQEQGWANVVNGELLSLAESDGFHVLLTADANIKNQQNLIGRNISIVVLRAYDNRLTTHVEMIDDLKKALTVIKSGEIVEVFHRLMVKNNGS